MRIYCAPLMCVLAMKEQEGVHSVREPCAPSIRLGCLLSWSPCIPDGLPLGGAWWCLGAEAQCGGTTTSQKRCRARARCRCRDAHTAARDYTLCLHCERSRVCSQLFHGTDLTCYSCLSLEFPSDLRMCACSCVFHVFLHHQPFYLAKAPCSCTVPLFVAGTGPEGRLTKMAGSQSAACLRRCSPLTRANTWLGLMSHIEPVPWPHGQRMCCSH
mmetsp:Transcript_25338/g.38505  ORF Transcript_25338/g.38505 Transcript_25338/m.38505 type:complete len:214 (-) Transcript_25338:92-733(-)